MVRHQTTSLLSEVADLERLINRVRGNIVTPRELVTLRRGLEAIPKLRECLGDDNTIDWLKHELKPCPQFAVLIAEAVVDQPPASLAEGGVIKPGFSHRSENEPGLNH